MICRFLLYMENITCHDRAKTSTEFNYCLIFYFQMKYVMSVFFLSGENKDTQNVTVCGEDHYLHTDPGNNSLTCQPCGLGTYMDEQNHAKTACKNCTEIVGKYFLPKACMSSQINYYNTNSDELSNNIIIVKTVISIQNIVTVFCLSVLTLIFNNWRLKKLKKGYMKWFTVIRLIVFPLTSVTLNIILLFKEYSLWVNVAAVIVGVTCAVYLMLHIKFGSKGYITDSERNMSHRNPEFNLHNRDSNLPRYGILNNIFLLTVYSLGFEVSSVSHRTWICKHNVKVKITLILTFHKIEKLLLVIILLPSFCAAV